MRIRLFFVLLLAALSAAGSLFCTELKTVALFSEQFHSISYSSYDEGTLLLAKKFISYTAKDTIFIEYSDDLVKYDSLILHHPFEKDGLRYISVLDSAYLFYTGNRIISVDRKSKKVLEYYDMPLRTDRPSFFSRFALSEGVVYGLNSTPHYDTLNAIEFQPIFKTGAKDLKSAEQPLLVTADLKGFNLMYVHPRQAVAFFQKYFIAADPCLESIYYHDWKGELISVVRFDSLLGVRGRCAELESLKVNRDRPKGSFDKLMDIKDSGSILRSVDHYKGKLLVRIATGEKECDTYIINPETLKWEKLAYSSKDFSWNDIPINNYSTIEGNYITTSILGDIKNLDLSRFKSYEEFKKYTEENKNTGTSYLVREIVFE